jgi:energy-coupling factor transport system substrate-specific component
MITAVEPSSTWRTRDIVVAAVIAVAFGVFFWAFGAVWSALAILGPMENILYAFWLLPAIVVPLVVRKPGAALFAELVAAGLAMALGSPWGPDVLISGFLQGAGAEVVFSATRYRDYRAPILGAASVGSMLMAFGHDWLIYYQTFAPEVILAIGAFMLISALLVLPFCALALVGALRKSGVLAGFAGA